MNSIRVVLKLFLFYNRVTQTEESHRLFCSFPEFYRRVMYVGSVLDIFAREELDKEKPKGCQRIRKMIIFKYDRSDRTALRWSSHCKSRMENCVSHVLFSVSYERSKKVRVTKACDDEDGVSNAEGVFVVMTFWANSTSSRDYLQEAIFSWFSTNYLKVPHILHLI